DRHGHMLPCPLMTQSGHASPYYLLGLSNKISSASAFSVSSKQIASSFSRVLGSLQTLII
ncbi:MAG: hypothetical protein WBE42_19065, partial [Pseudolabrys sp.]